MQKLKALVVAVGGLAVAMAFIFGAGWTVGEWQYWLLVMPISLASGFLGTSIWLRR